MHDHQNEYLTLDSHNIYNHVFIIELDPWGKLLTMLMMLFHLSKHIPLLKFLGDIVTRSVQCLNCARHIVFVVRPVLLVLSDSLSTNYHSLSVCIHH